MTPHVVALGPSGFAGAGRIMCNGLMSMARRGVLCTYVGPTTPFPWREVDDLPIALRWRSKPVTSGAIGAGAAIGDSSVLLPVELADEAVKAAREAADQSSRTVLWAHYLFPYGVAAHLAKSVLATSGIEAELWLNPAGSDIWEVGTQLKDVTTGLLNSSSVDRVVTYSDRFSAEIADTFGVARSIDVVKPSVEEEYRALPVGDRAASRRRLGFPENEFIISFHSNMRPVKAPQDVLMVARRAASQLPARRSSLVLAGPLRDIDSSCADLRVRRLGVVRQMAELLQVVDVEVNLSRHDSFNLSLAEAMACGVPVVTTDVVGIADDIVASGAGFTVPLERVATADARKAYDSAVRGIVTLGGSEGFRTAAGDAGAAHAKRTFSESAYWDRISRFLGGGVPRLGRV